MVSVDFEKNYGFRHRSKMCHTTKSYGTVVHILNLITKDYYGFFTMATMFSPAQQFHLLTQLIKLLASANYKPHAL